MLAPAGGEARDSAEHACLQAGLALLRGNASVALLHVEAALAAREDFSQAHLQKARIVRVVSGHREALAAFERATALAPDDAVAWGEQAQTHLALGERGDARDCYELALAHAPNCVAARLGLSRLLREDGDGAAALEHVRHAVRIAPNDAANHLESARVHGQSGDVQGAIAAYLRALELNPNDAAASANLGLVFLSQFGDPRSALRYFERAVELDPLCVAAQANLGLALDEQGRTDEALAHYERLIASYPAESEYRWNRGLARLGRGDFERGWEDYEMRNALGRGAAPRAFPFPVWQGEALRHGTALLIYAEQGVGDEIMFASCVPDVLARGIDCVIECDQRLARLFARSFSGARVHGAARDGDRSWLAEYSGIKAQISIGSLPRLLRRSAADFPSHSGYLRADPGRVAYWRARLGAKPGRFAAGIAWRGGTVKTRGALRSIPPECLGPLFDVAPLNWVALQRDGGQEAVAMAELLGPRAVVATEALQNFDECAALIEALDCVVTSDNTIAHMAGALGRNALVMLPRSPDWRWQNQGVASPWYPSVQLFRQRVHGDWAEVVTDVVRVLRATYGRQ